MGEDVEERKAEVTRMWIGKGGLSQLKSCRWKYADQVRSIGLLNDVVLWRMTPRLFICDYCSFINTEGNVGRGWTWYQQAEVLFSN